MATRKKRQSVKFIGVVPDEIDHVPNKRRCIENKHVQNTTTLSQPVLQEQTTTIHLKPTFEQRQLLSTYPRNIRLATFVHDREKQLVTAKLHHSLQTLPLQPIFVLDVGADLKQIIGIYLVFESSLKDAFYLSRKDLLAPNVSPVLVALEKIVSFNSSTFIKPFSTTKHIETFLQQFLPSLFY
jgi:hypothetical protein